MRPPARAVVGNLIWSTDGGVWAVWRVAPIALGYVSPGRRGAVQQRLHGLVADLPPDTMLLSVCERLDPLEVAVDMADDVDLHRFEAWSEACELATDWLTRAPVYRRRHYLAARLPHVRRAWRDVLRDTAADVGSMFGIAPTPVTPAEVEAREAQAERIEARLRPHLPCHPVTAGEVCWLYARALRREAGDPPFDPRWEPPDDPHGTWARLTDAVVREGDDPPGPPGPPGGADGTGWAAEGDGPPAPHDAGDPGDPGDLHGPGGRGSPGNPRHRRYLRIDSPGGTAYHTVFALADLPHVVGPGDPPGDWLFRADDIGFPVDWCVRVRAAPAPGDTGTGGRANGHAHRVDPRALQGVGHPGTGGAHGGDVGDGDRGEPLLQVTVLLSVAAPDLAELEDKAAELAAAFPPRDNGLARPSRDQTALWRSMLPGTGADPACDPYTQFMSPAELAGGAPLCSPDVGDPGGLLLGVSLDGGTGTPVLLDPAVRRRTTATPSVAVTGDTGSGKSFLLKRLCWDTVARGGRVVAVDATPDGEYARLAAGHVPGRVQVLPFETGGELGLDPLRSGDGDGRLGTALSFLSLLVGCPPGSDEALTLARAVEAVADHPDGRLDDAVDELARRGTDPGRGALAARLARHLLPHRSSPSGQLAFGDGRPPPLDAALDADLVVIRLPGLALPAAPAWRTTTSEEVRGQALLYLATALALQLARRDRRRFTATLHDEAGALLTTPQGRELLAGGMREAAARPAALWLASPEPRHFAAPEVDDVIGCRLAFHQSPPAVPAALRFLGVDGSDAGAVLDEGLGAGQCLYRDAHGRVGLVHVLPPLQPDLAPAFDKVPPDPELGPVPIPVPASAPGAGPAGTPHDVHPFAGVEDAPATGALGVGAPAELLAAPADWRRSAVPEVRALGSGPADPMVTPPPSPPPRDRAHARNPLARALDRRSRT